MGLFDFMKKKGTSTTTQKPIEPKVNSFGESFDRLTKDGELPFGWIYRNKEFVDKINGEFSHFLNMWLNSRRISPKEHYSALKSFVLYLEDAEKLCISKGECFEFWFYECVASKDYIEKKKIELAALTATFDDLIS